MQNSFSLYPGFSIHGVEQFAGPQPGFSPTGDIQPGLFAINKATLNVDLYSCGFKAGPNIDPSLCGSELWINLESFFFIVVVLMSYVVFKALSASKFTKLTLTFKTHFMEVIESHEGSLLYEFLFLLAS